MPETQLTAIVERRSNKLFGLNALVTGSSRGIGRAIARSLGAHGANVAVHCRQGVDEAQSLALELSAAGSRAMVVCGDLAKEIQARRVAEEVLGAFSGIDILINNAGITRDKSFLKMTRDQWQDVVETNLNSLYSLTQAVLPQMTQRGWGRIINISSVVGQMGAFGQTNYAAAKAGIIGFTKALARETAARGVTVNAVAPGYIETAMTAAIPPDVKAKIVETIPAKRFGAPEEVAEACLFLASREAAYITGAVINVNGGVYL